jgi:peptide/nickel transport system substrate-binding protein
MANNNTQDESNTEESTADSNDQQKVDSIKNISRRRILRGAAATGIGAALSGCQGGGDGGENTSGGTTNQAGGTTESGDIMDDDNTTEPGTSTPPPETETVDRPFISYVFAVPQDLQYNYYNPKNTESYPREVMLPWTTVLNNKTNKRVPLAFEDWTTDGTTFEITVSDEYTWHDGKDLTAQDVVTTIRLDDLMGAIGTEIDDISMSGERKVTLEFAEELNPQVLENDLLSSVTFVNPHQQYKEFINRLDEAGSEDEREKIKKDLSSYTIEEPIGAGPFQFENANARELVLKKFDDYPREYVQKQHSEVTGNDITDWPTDLNFDTLKFSYQPDHGKVAQAIKADKVDGGPGVSQVATNINLAPDHFELLDSPTYWGIGLQYNFWEDGDDIWEDRRVRQALSYIVDQQAVGNQKNKREAKIARSHPWTGLSRSVQKDWLSEDTRNSLQFYKQDFEKAEKLLKDAGFTKENDKWYKPNGDRFEVPFKTGACVTHYVSMIQVANAQFERFGIKTSLESLDCTSFFGKSYKERDYQLTTPGFWGGFGPHPWYGFNFVYSYSPADYLGELGPTLEAPPVGKPDSDERIEINVPEKMAELKKNISEEKQKEIAEELAWVTNWNAVKIPTNRQINKAFITRDDWSYPDSESVALGVAKFNCGVFWAFKAGICQAKVD